MYHIPADITVLAVDDDAEFTEIIAHYLTEEPRYHVITADSGQKALEILKNQPISAIIADYQMPEMDGLDLLRLLRAEGNDIPFIIFTGQGCEDVAIKALNEGADFYLVKGEDPGPQFLVLRKNLGKIVEKKHADEALRRSEAENRRMLSLLRATLEATEDGILVETNDGKIVGSNERLLKLLKINKKNLEGSIREDLCSSLRLQMAGPAVPYENQPVSSLLLDEGQHNLLSFYDGRVIETYSRPQVCEGEVVGKVWSYHDLTDRFKAEADLRESREKFRILFDNSPISHQALDKDGKILEVNQTWISMLGYPREEVIGKNIVDLCDPSCRKIITSCIESIKNGGLVHNLELILRTNEGKPVTVIVDGLAVTGNDGVIIQIQCALRDVTEQRKTEKQLIWAESILAQIVDLLPFGICVTAGERKEIIFENNRFRELWGKEKPGVPTKTISINLDDFLSSCHIEVTTDCLQDGTFLSGLSIRCVELTLPDRRVLRSYQRLFSDSDNNPRQLWAFEDISQYKKDEDEIRQYARRLEILGKIISFSGKSNQIASLCDMILQSIIPLLKFEGGCVHLFSEDRQNGELVASSGIRDELLTKIRFIPAGFLPDSVKQGQLFFSESVSALFPDLKEIQSSGSHALIPVIGQGTILGLISLFNRQIIPIQPDEEIILNGIGREIGGAVIRIKDHDALKNARHNLDNLVNSITDMVFVVDSESGVILEVNEEVLRRLGYCREELIGMSVQIPMAIGIPFFPHELLTDTLVVMEHTLPAADGGQIHVETSTATGLWNVRSVRFYVSRDISESVAAQERIRRSEERLRALFESSPIGIVLYDRDGNLIDLNSAFLTILGTPNKESLSGISIFSFPGIKEEVIREIQVSNSLSFEYVLDFTDKNVVRLFNSQKVEPIEIRMIITAMNVVNPEKDAGFLVLIEDITAERQMLRLLSESEAFNRGLITHLPDYIMVYDQEGRILFINPTGLSGLRAKGADLLGSSIYDYVIPNQRSLIEKQMRKRIRGDEVSPYEIKIIRTDGTLLDVMVQATRIPYQGSEAVLVVLTDITSLKEAEQALENYTHILQKTVNALAAANKKLNLLSDVTRHDILNQIHLIFNYLDFLESEPFSNDSPGYLKKIEESTSIIHRQIEFTRSYQDLGVNAPEWQNLSHIIDKLRMPGITLMNRTQGYTIHADPLLPKVFENLLDNSIRHGQETTEIMVSVLPDEEGGILISWTDNGLGVPGEDKGKIFEKGYGKNTGFGLFLIREILALTGISIRETGIFGKGACFELNVPKESVSATP